ncbi:hypothetical protein OSTOST_16172 [Ostertagia ostertagi]
MILFDKVALPEYVTNLWQWDIEWEEENPDYRCLLGRVHVVVLLWFELLAIPLYVAFLFPWWLFFIGPHLVIIVLTLYALKKEKHRWMWPINLYADIMRTSSLEQMIVGIVKAIILLIGGILFWRLTVFHTTRKYFEAKAEGAAFPNQPRLKQGWKS